MLGLQSTKGGIVAQPYWPRWLKLCSAFSMHCAVLPKACRVMSENGPPPWSATTIMITRPLLSSERSNRSSPLNRLRSRLVHTQLGMSTVGHQDHHPAHAAGNQCVAGRGGQVDGVGEATRLDQQLSALFAPLRQVFGGGCRGWLQTGMHRARAPWPDQRDSGMPKVGHGVITRAVGGLLVQLLLHLAHRYLQVEAGQVLPALTVRTVPGMVRRERQPVG